MDKIVDIRELMEVKAMTKLEFEARREYLEGYTSIVRQLKLAMDELDELDQDIGPRASRASGMPRSGKVSDGSDQIINRMERQDKLRAAIRRDIARMEKKRDEILNAIQSTQQERLREVLRYRYIMDMDIEQIASEMHYSYRQVQNLHNRAVQRIKLPGRATTAIKAEMFEMHPEWAGVEVKYA